MAMVQYQVQITQLDQVWELIKIGKGFVLRKWVYKVFANTTSFTPPLCIEVCVQSQESEQSCIYVLGIYILSLAMITQLDSEIFRQYFSFVFHFIIFACLFNWWCLTPLSIIFQLYRVDILICLFVFLFDDV